MASQGALVMKNSPVQEAQETQVCLICGSGRSPGGGHGNPLQNSYLENPKDRGQLGGYSPWGHKEWDMTEAA